MSRVVLGEGERVKTEMCVYWTHFDLGHAWVVFASARHWPVLSRACAQKGRVASMY